MEKLIRDRKSQIMYRKWDVRKPRVVFLLVHGMGAHSGRWKFLAQFFLRHRIASYALELQGFGHTKGIRGHADSFYVYFRDMKTLCNIILKEHPGCRIFLIGESFGGLLSYLLSSAEHSLFDGVVCISPAFRNLLPFGIKKRLAIMSALLYNPKKSFIVPFNSPMCTRDMDYVKVMDASKAEHRVASAWLLFSIANAQFFATLLKPQIENPVLFLLAGRDCIADAKKSRAMFNSLYEDDKKIIEYPVMHHALSVDIGKEKVFRDILLWTENHLNS